MMLYTACLLTELLQGKGMWLWDTGDCVAFGVKARHFSQQHVSEPALRNRADCSGLLHWVDRTPDKTGLFLFLGLSGDGYCPLLTPGSLLENFWVHGVWERQWVWTWGYRWGKGHSKQCRTEEHTAREQVLWKASQDRDAHNALHSAALGTPD